MIRIKQATKHGWIDCCDGGVADLSYPNSNTRRGRVEGGEQFAQLLQQLEDYIG